ncbi:hypothetical protein [Knoellia koreensis]|uniref:Uncharacterized protein n=1 Tax=Knoellia koreensis TaxID=2730921 RepID=A0A849HAS8_9MICO|nr:hypothetical protein [Knoellia sp. DB2414S]NNM44518.1 hypothetical protein [Knoellia sp. DB2414S]
MKATGRDLKTCPRCESTLDRSAFGKDRTRADGLRVYCRPCSAAIVRERAEREPETARRENRAAVARYYAANRPAIAAQRKARREGNR